MANNRKTPKGHIRRHGNRFEVAVCRGRDPITRRYRYAYESAATYEEAERERDRLLERLGTPGCLVAAPSRGPGRGRRPARPDQHRTIR